MIDFHPNLRREIDLATTPANALHDDARIVLLLIGQQAIDNRCDRGGVGVGELERARVDGVHRRAGIKRLDQFLDFFQIGLQTDENQRIRAGRSQDLGIDRFARRLTDEAADRLGKRLTHLACIGERERLDAHDRIADGSGSAIELANRLLRHGHDRVRG